MLTYDLKVGYACNNNCKHCVIDDSKDKLIESGISTNLTTEECLLQIDEQLAKGIDSIVLTGGEVTIRKDFPILIKKCVDNKLAITIQTNGRRLADSNVIEAVRNVDNIRFVVALHGSNEATHDNITQVNGSFRETCEGIKRMCKLKKMIVLKVVISKINAKELPRIITLVAELGVRYICFAFPHGQGAARKNFDEVIPRYSELRSIFSEMVVLSKKCGCNIEFEAVPFCIIPYAMQMVGELKYYDGDTLCTQVKEETFQWSKVRRSIKRKGQRCSECDMNEFCEGIWCEYAEAFGTEELNPIIFPIEKKKLILAQIHKFLSDSSNNL